MNSVSLLPQIGEILKSSINENIENFEISLHDGNKKGEGFLGQLFFVSLRHKTNGKQFHFVVKQAFSDPSIRKITPIKEIFLNEINFYTKLWPKLKRFQEQIPSIYQFQNLPNCVTTSSKKNVEKLVLENLKFQGYVVHEKKKPLEKFQFEYIFKVYGRLHAISFAYKALNPEEFSELVDGITDIWKMFADIKMFNDSVKITHEKALNSLQPGVDDSIINKYKHYIDDGIELFRESLSTSEYSAIIHGDCWSNNMMFKYDDSGKIMDLKLLDFQLHRFGSPVCDLSYCLYSGGTKDIFDDLDYLLQVYHDSLSDNLRAYGCDPEKLYPLKALKGDWKKHSQLGLYMGLTLWMTKLTDDENMLDFTDLNEDDEENHEKLLNMKIDEESFKKRAKDVLLHMYENDYFY